MDKPECSICDNIFDSNDHRPRVLPCGHGFCSLCIETSIHRGDKTCAICRKGHGAKSSTDLPVSFLLEDFAHKLAVSASEKYVPELDHDSNYGMCPKHKGIPLYFKCKSHSIKVCHSCVVIDHPPTSCQLISFEDEIKETKYSQIEALKKQNQVVLDMERVLFIRHQENIGDIDLLVSKLEQINKEITEKRKYQEQLRVAIKECQNGRKYLIIMENKLSAATNNQDVAIQCDMEKNYVLQSEKWEEKLKKELNIELNIEELYGQVEIHGIPHSCKVRKENGSIFIPCLSREVRPPSSARLIRGAELGLNSITTDVFMDVSERGCSLGRLFIRVFTNTFVGKVFIKLVLGYDGRSLKGTNFFKRSHANVQLEDWMTEGGSKGKLFLNYELMYNEKQTKPIRGMIFGIRHNFVIWNNNIAGRNKFPSHFGNIYSGMNIIDTIASKNHGVIEITISDCGIVLKS